MMRDFRGRPYRRRFTLHETADGEFYAVHRWNNVETHLTGWELVAYLQRLQHDVMESLRTEAVEKRRERENG